MEQSSRFFENKECQYYPCHKGIDEMNCLFCYCPFYAWEKCPGKNIYKVRDDGRKIKACTDCTFPHDPENYHQIISILKQGPEAFERQCPDALQKQGHAVRDIQLVTEEPCFYGIGVGPGNAKLITKQAEEVISKVDCLILPAKDKESCRAYQITKEALPWIDQKECLFYPFPMSMKEPQLTEFHQETAKKVMELLEDGKQVGFLTIGDVSIYSTYIYIEQIVKNAGYHTSYISGISSFSAAASRLGIPLTIGSEELHVIPGSGDVENALKLNGTLVFMKSGKRLKELKERLFPLEQERTVRVYVVSNCGMEDERIYEGTSSIDAENAYLTVVIVRPYSDL